MYSIKRALREHFEMLEEMEKHPERFILTDEHGWQRKTDICDVPNSARKKAGDSSPVPPCEHNEKTLNDPALCEAATGYKRS